MPPAIGLTESPAGKNVPGGAAALVGFTAEEPGEFQFVCTIHPQAMRGTLIIE